MASNIRNFKAVGENLYRIIEKMLENDDLCKLIHYSNENPLSMPDLTDEERQDLLHKNILIVPKIPENDDIRGSYIVVLYNDFIASANSEFKEADLVFIVVSPPEDWIIENGTLRPFLIMSEIDSMFNNQKIANIGKLSFVKSDRIVINSQLTGYTLTYTTYEFN